jgi:hypothetical protein
VSEPLEHAEVRIAATVMCAAWLVRHVDADTARRLRDEFLAQWGYETDQWDSEVDSLADYARRKGEASEDDWFLALRVDGPEEETR